MRGGSVMAGPWEAFGPDRLELGEGARIFSGRLHYVDLLQGRVLAPLASPAAANDGPAHLSRAARGGAGRPDGATTSPQRRGVAPRVSRAAPPHAP